MVACGVEDYGLGLLGKDLEDVAEGAQGVEKDRSTRGRWSGGETRMTAEVEREEEKDEGDGEVPAKVVGEGNAEPWTTIEPHPSVKQGGPDRVLGEIP